MFTQRNSLVSCLLSVLVTNNENIAVLAFLEIQKLQKEYLPSLILNKNKNNNNNNNNNYYYYYCNYCYYDYLFIESKT